MKDNGMNNKFTWTMPFFSRRRIKKNDKAVQDDTVVLQDSLRTSCTARNKASNESRKKHLDSSHHSNSTCVTADEDFVMNTTTSDEYIQDEQNSYNIANLIFEYNSTEDEEGRKGNSTKCYAVEIPNNVQDGDAFYVKAGTTLLEMICPQYHSSRRRREYYNTLVFELVPCLCDICYSCHDMTLDDNVFVRRKRRHYPQLTNVRVVNYEQFQQFTNDIEALTQQPNDDCPSNNISHPTTTTLNWIKGWNSFTNIHIEQLRLALITDSSALKHITIANVPLNYLEAIVDVLAMSCTKQDTFTIQNTHTKKIQALLPSICTKQKVTQK